MFDFLNYFGNKVVGRYKTLESNVRSRSNSFYDAFLDLLEDTIKTILMKEEIGYDGRTCGEILREPDINNFFKFKVNIDKEVYAKVSDYIRKINEHKHSNEKYITVDTVINYLNIYFVFVSKYLVFKNVETGTFNESYFRSIFGVTLERSKELDNVSEKVDSFVSSTNTKFNEYDTRISSLEAYASEFNKRIVSSKQVSQQNAKSLTNQITDRAKINWFFKNCKKSWRWFGNQQDFDKSKKKAYISYFILFALGIISSLITSFSASLYTTFTLFENIWLFFNIVLLIYASKAKLKYQSVDLANNTNYKYTIDEYGLWNPGPEKKHYKVLRWLSIISVIGNIIYVWCTTSKMPWLATIFEALFLASIIFSYFMNRDLFEGYTFVYLEGPNYSHTEDIKLIWDNVSNRLDTEEEYKKHVTFLF